MCQRFIRKNYYFIGQANFRPFIFELFLLHAINELTSKCTVTNEFLEFNLEKIEKNLHWTSVNAELSKEEKARARAEALANVQRRSQDKTVAKQGTY